MAGGNLPPAAVMAASGAGGAPPVSRPGSECSVGGGVSSARSQRARRGHLGDPGNLAELFLERCCHRRCHGLRIGARQLRGHRDRRIVHVRQRRHRQQRIGGKTDQQQPHHQQRGRDRTSDEGRGEVHGIWICCALCAAASSAALPCRMVTWLPGCSLYCPSTTTCSFAASPLSMSASPLLICATVTVRCSTVLSGLIT